MGGREGKGTKRGRGREGNGMKRGREGEGQGVGGREGK